MVKYGYYDDPRDIDEVLKFLISLLDGSNDVPFPSEQFYFDSLYIDMTQFLQILYFDSLDSDPITLESFRSAGRYQNTAANRAVFAVKEK